MIEAPLARPCLNWVAIDIARYSNAVLIETASGQKHRFRMSNSAVDMQRLVEFLGSLGGQCRVAMEPTGDYHRPIAHRLLVAGFEVVSISSVAQSRFREAMFNSWDKNDPKDASVILEMLKLGRTQRFVDPMIAGHHDIQELSKTYYQISRARTKVQHAIINHHVPLYFPEMHKYWSSTRNDWWVRFMIEFPPPLMYGSTLARNSLIWLLPWLVGVCTVLPSSLRYGRQRLIPGRCHMLHKALQFRRSSSHCVTISI